jgi:hypothetical protein
MNWLLLRSDGFSMFTDHQNLIYVFNPHRYPSGISVHSAAKLIRWALKLPAYQYTIEYISGHENVWSDMMTRWAAPQPFARMSAFIIAPLAPNLDADFH